MIKLLKSGKGKAMGIGIVLGIMAGLVAGAMNFGATKDANGAFIPAFIVGIGVFAFCKYQEDKGNKMRDKPGSFVTQLRMEQAFGVVKQVLTESHMGERFWSIRSVEPESWRIVATINWQEYIGEQVGQAVRQVTVTATLSPSGDSATAVDLDWQVNSPLNRGQVNELIDGTTAAIKHELK